MTEHAAEDVRELLDEVYRNESRRVLATLIRLLGDFDLAEEALHDAFRAALEQWPRDGAPANPRAWLVSAGRFKAIDTLRLIADDGPYPYAKDGSTFSNREGLLPKHPSGWYREFTVVTPGSDDRGARRIIAGQDGSRFYTSDHYSSFREVVSGEMS